jgi:hypothetical protein
MRRASSGNLGAWRSQRQRIAGPEGWPQAPLRFPEAGRMLLNFPGFDEGNAREACTSAISPAILLVQGASRRSP